MDSYSLINLNDSSAIKYPIELNIKKITKKKEK